MGCHARSSGSRLRAMNLETSSESEISRGTPCAERGAKVGSPGGPMKRVLSSSFALVLASLFAMGCSGAKGDDVSVGAESELRLEQSPIPTSLTELRAGQPLSAWRRRSSAHDRQSVC